MSETGQPNGHSKYAWQQTARKGLPKRSGQERVADFLEIYGTYDEATAREQASRCIQCPSPSCVTGCPLCNPIPEWMLLTAEGRFLEAAAVLGSATNMAEICARLCPSEHWCEQNCLLDSVSEAVPIQALEQFLTEYAFANEQVDVSTAPPNGLKVAIVGSGPGCLSCAEELAKTGYATTVFDSALVPGGLLVNGTPAFKLDQSILQRRIEILKKRGVIFRLGTKFWEEITLGQLLADYDAVYLGLDSRKARALKIPGSDLDGVVQALPFLLQQNACASLQAAPVAARGKRVMVLGGGDTAIDCLRAAIRYGAREAIGVYRRGEADMPGNRRDYQNAVEEGAKFVFCAAPTAVLGDERGHVKGVRFVRTELGTTEEGGPRPFLIQPGTEFDLDAEYVVAALGFEAMPLPRSGEFSELAVNEWGGLIVNEHQATSIPRVFAGGEIVNGLSPVLHTVRDGRKAAAGIQALLKAARTSDSARA
jgi:glutamate synthase (NADPH) small chain